MSDSEVNTAQNDDSLVTKVLEAIQNVKKKHSSQYLENIARECEKTFGWNRPMTEIALQHATERNLLRTVQVEEKISYRVNDDKYRNVGTHENTNTAACQTDNEMDIDHFKEESSVEDHQKDSFLQFLDGISTPVKYPMEGS